MYAWEAVQNSLNYIEDHLSEKMEIETLSKVAALSPYYYQRLFSRLVNTSVNDYIRLRRLAKASEYLKCKDKRIVDIAAELGFSDQANFTRAFKDAYGITPSQFHADPVILNNFIKPDLLLNHTMVDENVPLIADGVVVEVTRKELLKSLTFIGIEGKVPIDEVCEGKDTSVSSPGLIWDSFHHIKSNIQNLVPNGKEFGIMYKADAKEGYRKYLAGAEVISDLKEEGYVSYTLPCGEYIICCFEAENFIELTESAIFKALSFMKSWIKKHNLECGHLVAEMYYGVTPDASYMEIWIPLKSNKAQIKNEKINDIVKVTEKPSLKEISEYINNSLFDRLCTHVETEYQSKPVLEYSRCSMQYGWNIKYKKSGRTLCTLYPMDGFFITLIVIGERERTDTEIELSFCTDYVQQLYKETETGMGQKWLMIHVTDDAILEDVKQLIAVRRKKGR